MFDPSAAIFKMNKIVKGNLKTAIRVNKYKKVLKALRENNESL